ncbi:MAG: hypothetical protein CL904_05990 [Dehalococcoidia bacterium]|nr:hypothetical protein [Dehalococcoidia bacterium]MQG15607.1 NAD(P)-dependent oxidoreductase [SAR202 cluster bacterium]|tara:strand:+ start:6230 stop:7057 length:828 start_codon:yes stop_codon:yes gene_type:complete
MTTKVLITGMSGLIGELVKEKLEKLGSYELTALNRTNIIGVKTIQADISDLSSIKDAFVGQDIVIHLAAVLVNADWSQLMSVNINGTYNVFEASRLAGVKRVVNASSGAAIKGVVRNGDVYKNLEDGKYEDVPIPWKMITHNDFHPYGLYGVSKMAGEGLARHFSDVHKLPIINLRIGTVRPSGVPEEDQDYSIYLSHRDVVQSILLAMNAPDDMLFETFLVTSDNKWGYRDIEHFRQVLGFTPEDRAEDFRNNTNQPVNKRTPTGGYWVKNQGL